MSKFEKLDKVVSLLSQVEREIAPTYGLTKRSRMLMTDPLAVARRRAALIKDRLILLEATGRTKLTDAIFHRLIN